MFGLRTFGEIVAPFVKRREPDYTGYYTPVDHIYYEPVAIDAYNYAADALRMEPFATAYGHPPARHLAAYQFGLRPPCPEDFIPEWEMGHVFIADNWVGMPTGELRRVADRKVVGRPKPRGVGIPA